MTESMKSKNEEMKEFRDRMMGHAPASFTIDNIYPIKTDRFEDANQLYKIDSLNQSNEIMGMQLADLESKVNEKT